MKDAESKLEEIKALLRLLDERRDFVSDWWGNGCDHGFKPASSCPNESCEERKAHVLWEKVWDKECKK